MRRALLLLTFSLLVIACQKEDEPVSREPLGSPFLDVLPSCPVVSAFSDEDAFAENPFAGLPAFEGWQTAKVGAAGWLAERGVEAEYHQSCRAVYIDEPESFVSVTAWVWLMSNEELAANQVIQASAPTDATIQWFDPEVGQMRLLLDHGLASMADQLDSIQISYRAEVVDMELDPNKLADWAYEEVWQASWALGDYYVTTSVWNRDRNFLAFDGARSGIVSLRPFDGWKILSKSAVYVWNRWPFADTQIEGIDTMVSNLDILIDGCRSISEDVWLGRFSNESRDNAPEWLGIQGACLLIADPGERSFLEREAVYSDTSFCSAMLGREYLVVQSRAPGQLSDLDESYLNGMSIGCEEIYPATYFYFP